MGKKNKREKKGKRKQRARQDKASRKQEIGKKRKEKGTRKSKEKAGTGAARKVHVWEALIRKGEACERLPSRPLLILKTNILSLVIMAAEGAMEGKETKWNENNCDCGLCA